MREREREKVRESGEKKVGEAEKWGREKRRREEGWNEKK